MKPNGKSVIEPKHLRHDKFVANLIGGIFVGLCIAMLVVSYYVNKNHGDKLAIKHYQQGNYREALRILNDLPVTHRRFTFINGCKYKIALGFYEKEQYDESLSVLKAIPETYQMYSEVKSLYADALRESQTVRYAQKKHLQYLASEHQRALSLARAEAEKREEAAEQSRRRRALRELYLETGINLYPPGQKWAIAFGE